ncbi:MAG: HAD family phosphatase [Desulfomonile sp.]|nr:HAD family phosphatase [Desulfomonile sp.]
MIMDIIFDLGNVLVPFDREIAYRRLRRHLSTPVARWLDQDRAGFEARLKGPATELETGRIGFDEFRRIVCDVLSIDLARDEFERIWCDMFWMDEDMVRLGETLSERYGTWLASNTSRAHYEWIIGRFPRVAFYRDAALSYELGVMKPARLYYEKSLERFGIDRNAAVFIDDLKENVAGARAAGINGILFKGREPLLAELRRLGVDIPGDGGAPS